MVDPAGRLARPAPDLCHRARAVRARLAGLRSLDHADDAEPVPGGAGHRGGDDVRYLARPYRAGVPPERARHRLWPLGRHHRVRGGGRAAGGWGAHRGSRLGVDLLRQRADRARNGRYDAGAGAEIGARPERQDRLRRPGHLQRRALLPRACAHPRKRRGLGGRVHRRPVRGHRPPAGRVHRDRAAHRAANAGPEPVPKAGLHRGSDRGLLAARVDVRDVPLPDPLPPEHPELFALRGGPAVSADLPAGVHRRADCREARGAASGARVPRRGPRPRRLRPVAHGGHRSLGWLDHSAPWLHLGRSGNRLRQPSTCNNRGRRRRAAAKRRRVRDQRHLPTGRHGHWNRGAGRTLPGQGHRRARHGARPPAAAARSRGPAFGGGELGRGGERGPRGPARGPRHAGRGGSARVYRRSERDPDRGRRGRVRRRHSRLRAGAPARLRGAARRTAGGGSRLTGAALTKAPPWKNAPLTCRERTVLTHRVTFIPGDGTGPEIAEATRRVLEATGVEFDWDFQDAGIDVYEREGNPLPDRTLASIREHGVAIKGPTTTPVGSGHRSINVALRKEFDLYSCIRPCKAYEGVRTRFPETDVVIVRENTEDLYAGIEFEKGSPEVERLRGFLADELDSPTRDESGISIKPISVYGSERIVESAFSYAEENGRRKVTAAHKANIMKFSDGLFLEVARQVAERHPDIEFEDRIIDNLCNQP